MIILGRTRWYFWGRFLFAITGMGLVILALIYLLKGIQWLETQRIARRGTKTEWLFRSVIPQLDRHVHGGNHVGSTQPTRQDQ